jgi:DNA-binding HxlR family transcriptional regulator
MPPSSRRPAGRQCPGLCPDFQVALDAVAKPWSGQILLALREGPLRYAELAERLPPLGDRMLSLRLKELEARGLLSRRVSETPPVRVSYELSPAGLAFDEVAQALSGWGRRLRGSEGAKATRAPRAPQTAKAPRPRSASRA